MDDEQAPTTFEQLDALDSLAKVFEVDPKEIVIDPTSPTLLFDGWISVKVKNTYFTITPDGQIME